MEAMHSYQITYHILFDSGNEITRTAVIQEINESRAKARLQAQINLDDVKQFTITECRQLLKLF